MPILEFTLGRVVEIKVVPEPEISPDRVIDWLPIIYPGFVKTNGEAEVPAPDTPEYPEAPLTPE